MPTHTNKSLGLPPTIAFVDECSVCIIRNNSAIFNIIIFCWIVSAEDWSVSIKLILEETDAMFAQHLQPIAPPLTHQHGLLQAQETSG